MRGMYPRQATQTRMAVRPGRAVACLLVLVLVLAAGSAWAGPRLDREEREQLRRELRQQDRDGGSRHYQDPDRGGYQRGGWERRGGWDPGGRPAREERHRMAPEDREQLRHMLREHRRGRRD